MKITEDTYYAILNACAEHSSETGGIIGGKNKIVSKFEFDEGTLLSSEQHYYPNVEKRAERSAQKAKGIILERKVLYLEKNTGRKGRHSTDTAIRTPKLDKGYVQQWAYSNEPPTG